MWRRPFQQPANALVTGRAVCNENILEMLRFTTRDPRSLRVSCLKPLVSKPFAAWVDSSNPAPRGRPWPAPSRGRNA